MRLAAATLHQLCCLLLSVSPMHDIVSGPTAHVVNTLFRARVLFVKSLQM